MTITSLQAISCLGDLFSRFRKMSFLFSSPRRTPESTEKIELVRGLPILWSLTTSWCRTPYQEIKRFYPIHDAYNNKLNSTKLLTSFKFKIKQEQENYTTNTDREMTHINANCQAIPWAYLPLVICFFSRCFDTLFLLGSFLLVHVLRGQHLRSGCSP